MVSQSTLGQSKHGTDLTYVPAFMIVRQQATQAQNRIHGRAARGRNTADHSPTPITPCWPPSVGTQWGCGQKQRVILLEESVFVIFRPKFVTAFIWKNLRAATRLDLFRDFTTDQVVAWKWKEVAGEELLAYHLASKLNFAEERPDLDGDWTDFCLSH